MRTQSGEAADGQASLDDSFDTLGQHEAFLQGELGITGIVSPIAFPYLRRSGDVEIDVSLKGEASQGDTAIVCDIEQQIDSFVKGKAGDKAMLVIDMGTQRTHPVGREDVIHSLLTKIFLE